jgi:hypothetical protein
MLWCFLRLQELMGGKELAPPPEETICSTAAKIFPSDAGSDR